MKTAIQSFVLGGMLLLAAAGCRHGRAAEGPSPAPGMAAGEWAELKDTMAAPAAGERLKDLTAEWETPHTVVLGNFHNLYNARVVEVPGDAYPFRMWLFGWAVEDSNPTGNGKYLNDAIYHARSKDLLHWEVYAGRDAAGQPAWDATMNPKLWTPVMTYGDKTWDNAANGDPSVVLKDGVFYMAFSSVGQDVRAGANGMTEHIYMTNCVMGARSRDGIAWEKTAAPIAIWDQEPAKRWDIAWRDPATPPKGYYGSYHRPSLLWDEGRWKLWFDYMYPGTFLSLGYAENRGDFMNPADWKVLRAGAEPLLKDWPNPNVVKAGGRYYAFSDAPGFPAALGGDGRVLAMAESADGINWTVRGCLRPEGMDCAHVPEAFVRREKDGEWLYLFYAWKPASKPGQPYDYRYKQIRLMRKKVG